MKKNNKSNSKVKNPCKICLETVNNKTGLQCQGACKRWAHFSCLNYTPGKIQDIKTGIIKILCPCPDCKTTEPKEYLTNPPYICPDQSCSAYEIPQCRSSDCPLSKQNPLPPREISFESNQKDSTYDNKSDLPSAESNQSDQSYKRVCPPPPSLESNPPRSKKNQQSRPRTPSSPKSQTPTSDKKGPQPSSNPSPKNIAQRFHPKLKDEKSFPQKGSFSCSCISKDSGNKTKIHTTSSDSHVSAKNHKALYQALEDMCNTVGQLSLQLKELMCRMIETIQSTSNK